MGECAGCRWWERRTDDASTFGLCRYLTTVKIDVGLALIRGERYEDDEKTFTSQDFGCIEFEAKG